MFMSNVQFVIYKSDNLFPFCWLMKSLIKIPSINLSDDSLGKIGIAYLKPIVVNSCRVMRNT